MTKSETQLTPKKVSTDDCWLWAMSICNKYGQYWYQGKVYKAHRFVYEVFVDEIPDGLEIDHLCKVTWCVNPEHLEPVTREENKKRTRSEFCRRGLHRMTGANLYTSGRKTTGTCYACRLAYARERWQRLKAEARV